MKRLFVLVLITSITVEGVRAQEEIVITKDLQTDPQKAAFVYDDVLSILRIHPQLTAATDPIALLQAEYFDKGTKGLAMFVTKYGLSAESLSEAISEHSAEYTALGRLPAWLRTQEQPIRDAFAKLKEMMPQVVFPPTYYLIGDFRGIASGSPEGQLITVERFDPAKKRLDALLVHELVHFQQLLAQGPDEFYAIFGDKKTLLALTIREGTAEFFADRVTGVITQEQAREYVVKNEMEIWKQFQADMNGNETNEWMWRKPADADQPKDVAYMVGSRIVAAYYERAEDKTRAVQEILSVTDYPAFLAHSGYANGLGAE